MNTSTVVGTLEEVSYGAAETIFEEKFQGRLPGGGAIRSKNVETTQMAGGSCLRQSLRNIRIYGKTKVQN